MALPAAAHAQAVQRCVGADGRAVYTDRRCDDIGAVDRLPPPGTAEGAHVFRGMCPRVLSQLVGEVGAAIRAGDANRLAGIYDWSGVSGKAASRVLDRLEAMVGRPLVDIAPVYPGYATDAAPPAPAPTQAAAPAPNRASEPPADRTAWMSSWPGMQPPEPTVDTSTLPAPPPLPPAPVRTHPVALRVEQTLSGSATPVRTVFGLRRTYGCFWITL
ncbi:MAG: DUF4124 domain-containing protein [Pseudoxanthomonas sp.]|nr:DUF4124 domain-containing protein [Pseudoxanthomonas sp.]